MSVAERKPSQPPNLLVLSPTEMTGDWTAEVKKKLVDQGVDPQLAAQIAGVAQAEMRPPAPKTEADRRPSFWRRILRSVGLSD